MRLERWQFLCSDGACASFTVGPCAVTFNVLPNSTHVFLSFSSAKTSRSAFDDGFGLGTLLLALLFLVLYNLGEFEHCFIPPKSTVS